MQEVFCKVKEIDLLGRDVKRVKLVCDELSTLQYQGGQYLTIQVEGGRWIPFSIANSPEQTSHIELHIKLIPGHQLAEQIIGQLESNGSAHIQIPMGQCVLRKTSRDVVCIAGGTGFAPLKAMLESAFSRGEERQFSLYWGARDEIDLYLNQLPVEWQKEYENFSYTPVVSEGNTSWTGATGFAHEPAITNEGLLNEKDWYISGSWEMVMSVYKALLEKGVSKEQIFADMLDIKREMGEDV